MSLSKWPRLAGRPPGLYQTLDPGPMDLAATVYGGASISSYGVIFQFEGHLPAPVPVLTPASNGGLPPPPVWGPNCQCGEVWESTPVDGGFCHSHGLGDCGIGTYCCPPDYPYFSRLECYADAFTACSQAGHICPRPCP